MKINLLRSLALILGALYLLHAPFSEADAQGTRGTTVPHRKTLEAHVAELTSQMQRVSSMPETGRLQVAIGLGLRNRDSLDGLFQQIYTPGNPNFHHYLTPAQFAEQFGPTKADYQKVIDYAKTNGLEVVGTFGNRTVVDVAGTVADMEKAFHVHLGFYPHPTERRQFFAPDVAPTVDPDVPIVCVTGLDSYIIPYPKGHRIGPARNQPAAPSGGSPPGLTNLYDGHDFRNAYAPGTTLDGSGQTVGLYEPQGYHPADITAYQNLTQSTLVPTVNVLLDGITNGPKSGNDEVASDIELAGAMAPGLRQVTVYEGTNADDIFNEMAYPTHGEPLPLQMSCSWGYGGDSIIQGDLIEFAVQGQSFLLASGDNGAQIGPANSEESYSANYSTFVGGTQLFMNGEGLSWSSEIVWHDSPGTNFQYFSSTGGILPPVSIPYWQAPISMSANKGSTQYRDFPDVAMVSRDIVIVSTDVATNPTQFGNVYSWVGTSASAPLWAGFTAMANQQAAQLGLPSVGFLNPTVYALGQGALYGPCFHDITSGNNAWNDTENGTSSTNLYPATSGYDLCTGWGSPTGTNLINSLVTFADAIFVNFNYTGSVTNGEYNTPFKKLGDGVKAVSSGGFVIIETAGSSSETPTISKPLTIMAIGGAATIGN